MTDEPDVWRERAMKAMNVLVARRVPFTSDDLLELVGPPDTTHQANAGNNRIGSLFQHAARLGLIEPVGMVKSSAPRRKGGKVRQWAPGFGVSLAILEHPDGEMAGAVLRFVHDPAKCAGRPCTVHNRTQHAMRDRPQHWRSDRGIMERICPHGVGHPDPDERFPDGSAEWVHGCDGCCAGAYTKGQAWDGK